ncbi:MAG: hypothetical protein CAF44_006280 [Nitrospira sp. CG24D]|jgi:hypothetical protein|nr:MAG: hypothetical protein CAF44_006280 [Nitrospira sp. CG24D]
MSPNLATAEDQFSDLSLKKQEIYRRYTNGELSWYQVAEGIEKIQPPPPQLSWKHRVALAISTFLVSMLIPPWAKRDE